MKPESILAKRVSAYLLTTYPSVPFRFDLAADQRTTIGVARKNKAIHGKWSKGHPDVTIFQATKKYGALFIELKATKTVHNSEHTRRQRAYHEVLKLQGYQADFACGFEEAKEMIDNYMSLKRKKVK
jgi:hypothetical protein